MNVEETTDFISYPCHHFRTQFYGLRSITYAALYNHSSEMLVLAKGAVKLLTADVFEVSTLQADVLNIGMTTRVSRPT
jgi:hypothetical protein